MVRHNLSPWALLFALSLGGVNALAQELPSDRTAPDEQLIEACATEQESEKKPEFFAGTSDEKFRTGAAALARDFPKNPAALGFAGDARILPRRAGTNSSAQGTTGAVTQSTYTPLTAEEKLEQGLKAAFLSPSAYLFTGLSAVIVEATEEDQPQKDTEDRVADGLSRFAIGFSTRSIKSVLGSGVYPALFKQDPRYERSGKKGFGPRALHAASRVFITRGDNGNLQPNVSRLAGTLSASALANLYECSTPGRDRVGVGPTFRRFGISLGVDVMQFILFREFGPDIKKLFGR